MSLAFTRGTPTAAGDLFIGEATYLESEEIICEYPDGDICFFPMWNLYELGALSVAAGKYETLTVAHLHHHLLNTQRKWLATLEPAAEHPDAKALGVDYVLIDIEVFHEVIRTENAEISEKIAPDVKFNDLAKQCYSEESIIEHFGE